MTQADNRRSFTVVATGPFAPGTFHPWWFAHHKLLGEVESKGTDQVLVTPDATIFNVAGFDIDVRTNRIQIGTTQENLFEPVRDLMCGVLDVLEGTFIDELGINWVEHYSTQSEKAWHHVGDTLVPKTMWNKIWPKRAGMLNLQVQLERNDDLNGKINLNFQPSNIVKNGIFTSINDHYNLKINDAKVSSAEASEFLRKHWTSSKETAEKLFKELYEHTNAT
ncbi:hypothetical protein [Hydrogenophaga sp. PBL-H3]|uniref:hypothetical protein n=1 Tax=Hydrogenophaga sp. PBL-H3 TaxID=434010 RepID=UPI00131F6710|nr:hypothetical protein [Hydrogenophaga sp. PBL-H3]QHE76787.1 hypothetical protein F9Z45_12315 [Hydrogenophaga sp. PBL-H3]QHE81211.1 hypothetical protein F9Z44_12315 [Hydrogenophaga sp. PBL-H3]